MSAFQTQSASPTSDDIKHLNLLSIGQYVAGGLLALFGCCPLIYFVIGLVLVAGVVPVEESSHQRQSSVTHGAPADQSPISAMPPEYRTPPISGEPLPGDRPVHLGSNSERNAQVAAGSVFIVISVIMVVVMWAIAIAIIIAGLNIRRRKAYTFCVVVGVVECVFMPLGTILGVFTLMVLTRPSVKALFDNPAAAAAIPTPSPATESNDIKQWP